MSLLWLLFASLAVVGSMAYNVGMKLGSPNTNPFGFGLIMSFAVFIFQILSCLVSRYVFKADVTQGITLHAIKFALLTGLATTVVDVSYFLALRYGSMVASQVFWSVGGIILLSLIAAFFFSETITPTKALGIAFGIASVVLITK